MLSRKISRPEVDTLYFRAPFTFPTLSNINPSETKLVCELHWDSCIEKYIYYIHLLSIQITYHYTKYTFTNLINRYRPLF